MELYRLGVVFHFYPPGPAWHGRGNHQLYPCPGRLVRELAPLRRTHHGRSGCREPGWGATRSPSTPTTHYRRPV